MEWLRRLFEPWTVNISGSSITDVAGDSHTHYGDVYTFNDISTQAGNQLRSHYSKVLQTLIEYSRFSLAHNLGPCFNGCSL